MRDLLAAWVIVLVERLSSYTRCVFLFCSPPVSHHDGRRRLRIRIDSVFFVKYPGNSTGEFVTASVMGNTFWPQPSSSELTGESNMTIECVDNISR